MMTRHGRAAWVIGLALAFGGPAAGEVVIDMPPAPPPTPSAETAPDGSTSFEQYADRNAPGRLALARYAGARTAPFVTSTGCTMSGWGPWGFGYRVAATFPVCGGGWNWGWGYGATYWGCAWPRWRYWCGPWYGHGFGFVHHRRFAPRVSTFSRGPVRMGGFRVTPGRSMGGMRGGGSSFRSTLGR